MSLQPANVRADIAALPKIARHTKSIWLPSVLLIAATLVAVLAGRGNRITNLLYEALVYPPPMAACFLAGFLTPRGAWLAGGVVGMVGALVFALGVGLSGGAILREPSTANGLIAFGFSTSPLLGIGVGAFSGFYRRFLALSSPKRGQQSKRAGNRRTAKRPTFAGRAARRP